MLKIQRQELRELTQAAIDAARRETVDKANAIFRTALAHLKAELAAGRSYAVVMSLKQGEDYVFPAGVRSTKSCKPDYLTGVAARVYKMCEVFDPTLEYWSRVEGSQRDEYTVEGFNVVLHWTDADDLIARVGKLGDDSFARELRASIEAAEAVIADKVRQILAGLKAKATVQAKAGKDWAIVMSLKSGTDFTKPERSGEEVLKPEWLSPVAKAVFDACVDFNPTLEFWSREQSDMRNETWTETGFNLVIHW